VSKKVRLKVITDAVQAGGKTYPNGMEFSVSEAKAKQLLKSGGVVKAA
jgi:hypothetical protein